MRTLLRALAKLVLAAKLPAADYPPQGIASMVAQCEAAGREDLGEKIMAAWAAVLDKYPNTRLNWAAAVAISANSLKKNVFGGLAFEEWFPRQTKQAVKKAPLTVPKGTPAIAVPAADETPEDWQAAAAETAGMLAEAGKAFPKVEEFIAFLEKECSELQRKLAEYGPGGEKHLLKSGKPHSFVNRIPKWQGQLSEYEKKLASVKAAGTEFKKTANDYESAKVTTVAFEGKVQDTLVDVLAFIMDIPDLAKQKALLDKFQANLKKMEEDKAAASVTAAGDFLSGLWDKVVEFWTALFSWSKKLSGAVDSFSSIVHVADGAGAEAQFVMATSKETMIERIADGFIDNVGETPKSLKDLTSSIQSMGLDGAWGEEVEDLMEWDNKFLDAAAKATWDRLQKKTAKSATEEVEYKFFLVDKNQDVLSGWDTMSDAKEAKSDDPAAIKIYKESELNEGKLAEFLKRNGLKLKKSSQGTKQACSKCGALFQPHWLKDGVCNGCRNPHLIVPGLSQSSFEHEGLPDLAEALYWWLQHNWEGQGDELYSDSCKLDKVYKPGMAASFEKMDHSAKEVYDELTRDNYKAALDRVLNPTEQEQAEAAMLSAKAKLNCEIPGLGKVGTVEFQGVDDLYIDKGRLGGTLTVDGKKYDGYFEYTEKTGMGWDFSGNGAKILKAINDHTFDVEIPAWDAFQGKVCTWIETKAAKFAKGSTELTCEEFFDSIDDYDLHTLIDEMHLEDNYSADTMFNYLKKKATKKGVTLTDSEEWDYESFFQEVYDAAEKGLS